MARADAPRATPGATCRQPRKPYSRPVANISYPGPDCAGAPQGIPGTTRAKLRSGGSTCKLLRPGVGRQARVPGGGSHRQHPPCSGSRTGRGCEQAASRRGRGRSADLSPDDCGGGGPVAAPGVIGIKDSDGLTWRYPLTEFTEDPGVNPEFAAFKEEMAEMVMDTCEVPEDQRQMWRDLR